MSVWLSEPTHVSIHVYFFPPDKYFTCFISFHLHVEIHFGSDGQGPCHWPLVPRGLAFLPPQPNLNLWPESKVPLQAAAGCGHPRAIPAAKVGWKHNHEQSQNRGNKWWKLKAPYMAESEAPHTAAKANPKNRSLWWSVLRVNLARPCTPGIWPNIILDVSIKIFLR